MFNDNYSGLTAVLFIIFPVLYIFFKKYLEKKEIRTRKFTDAEYLAGMAVDRKCSELDIFHMCADEWHKQNYQVEEDFKRYLKKSILPHYVRDYIRKNKKNLNPRVRTILDPGGNLPPNWSA